MPRPRYGLNRNLLHVRDEKASGTAGGTFTAGAWQVRDLNTVLTNEITGSALSSNTITGLKAGVYEVLASAPAYQVNEVQLRLYNVTAAVAVLTGVSGYAGGSATTEWLSWVTGRFTLAATSTLRLEHQCTTTRVTNGFGVENSFGIQVFADLQIRFLGT